tara:strand:- start:1098 stop:1622 length:525 start_codon:yes stop_codon:yes gene_type:complete
MITSENTDKILPALFELKKQLKPMTKDAKNPFFKSNYLKLEDLLDNLEPLLIDQGLIVSQANAHRHDDEYIISRITHAESGQYVETEYKIGYVEDSQKQGARATYGRRYSLKGLLGLSERDDDGNTASGKVKTPNKPTTTKPASGGFGGSKPAPAAEPTKEESKPTVRQGSFGG